MKNISTIKKIAKKMPKTINEAINFNDRIPTTNRDSDKNMLIDSDSVENEMEVSASEKARKLIDNIRKMTLKAMAELADTPNDESYGMLKRIWQLCDKNTEKQEIRDEK